MALRPPGSRITLRPLIRMDPSSDQTILLSNRPHLWILKQQDRTNGKALSNILNSSLSTLNTTEETMAVTAETLSPLTSQRPNIWTKSQATSRLYQWQHIKRSNYNFWCLINSISFLPAQWLRQIRWWNLSRPKPSSKRIPRSLPKDRLLNRPLPIKGLQDRSQLSKPLQIQ